MIPQMPATHAPGVADHALIVFMALLPLAEARWYWLRIMRARLLQPAPVSTSHHDNDVASVARLARSLRRFPLERGDRAGVASRALSSEFHFFQEERFAMRFLIEFSVPTQHGNDVVRSGRIAKIFKQLGEELKPEAMYFYPANGLRAGCIILQSDNPAICAAVGERLWFGLQAQVKATPIMNAEELGKGLSDIAKVIENYA